MTTERLFLALWPDDTVRAALAALCAGADSGRAVPVENIHLTLVFLGSLDRARRACVEDACAAVQAPAFELTLTNLRRHARQRMVWAAPVEVPASLSALVAGLNSQLLRCVFVPESRRFRAHVTLARDVRRRIEPRRFEAIRWKVEEFCLVDSRPGARGSVYAIRRRWPLVGAGAASDTRV